MERGRSWRRYKSKCFIIKRLKRNRKKYWFKDINNIRIRNPKWYDQIGTSEHFRLKECRSSYDNYYPPKWRDPKCDWFGKKNKCRIFLKKDTDKKIKEYYDDEYITKINTR